jgi:hypothetical protein
MSKETWRMCEASEASKLPRVSFHLLRAFCIYGKLCSRRIADLQIRSELAPASANFKLEILPLSGANC